MPSGIYQPIRHQVLRLLTIGSVSLVVGTLATANTAHACPPSLGITGTCHVQQFVAPQVIVQPQAVYAAPLVQQQVVSPFYSQQLVQRVVAPQKIIVQQVRQHHAPAIVQQVQVQKVVAPRVQVQRSRTVIRNR